MFLKMLLKFLLGVVLFLIAFNTLHIQVINVKMKEKLYILMMKFFQICYHTACGGTNDDESFDSIFPYRLNGCILIFRDASILQSTL